MTGAERELPTVRADVDDRVESEPCQDPVVLGRRGNAGAQECVAVFANPEHPGDLGQQVHGD